MGTNDETRIKDYVVLCYIFGNDFIERQYIIDDRIYNVLMSKYKYRLVNNDNSINFNEFSNLINHEECKRIVDIVLSEEYDKRQNKKKMLWKGSKEKPKEELIKNISQMYTYVEERNGLENKTTRVDENKYNKVWKYYLNGVNGCDDEDKMDMNEYNKELSHIPNVKLRLKEWSKHMWECEMAK